MFALMGCSVTLCTKQLGRHPRFNMFLVAVFTLGRFVLVLPFCSQPRFGLFGWHFVAGGLICIFGLAFLFPLVQITPWPSPEKKIDLKTTGFYGIVRNPIYLGEILWSLGWAIIFRSVIGVVLIPFWWSGFLFHIILEEEELERKLGKVYSEYKSQVRGRIIPGIPI
ncbi:MAG: hypothetical protein JSV56_00805 [Methanomassiliicoccales archaeon]|nr:MAG: hypothetical protein JSV56_00805 [Methanomassiliicoccales archaeon]